MRTNSPLDVILDRMEARMDRIQRQIDALAKQAKRDDTLADNEAKGGMTGDFKGP